MPTETNMQQPAQEQYSSTGTDTGIGTGASTAVSRWMKRIAALLGVILTLVGLRVYENSIDPEILSKLGNGDTMLRTQYYSIVLPSSDVKGWTYKVYRPELERVESDYLNPDDYALTLYCKDRETGKTHQLCTFYMVYYSSQANMKGYTMTLGNIRATDKDTLYSSFLVLQYPEISEQLARESMQYRKMRAEIPEIVASITAPEYAVSSAGRRLAVEYRPSENKRAERTIWQFYYQDLAALRE